MPFINTNKLEFDIIKKRLKDIVLTDEARNIIDKENIETDYKKVNKRLNKASQFKKVYLSRSEFYLENLYDLKDFLNDLDKEIFYQIPERYKKLQWMLEEAVRVKDLLDNLDDEFDLVKSYKYGLVRLRQIIDFINKRINEDGEIKDNATKKLKGLIDKKKNLNKQLRKKINQALKKYNNKNYLQEDIYTSRNDRYVLPVKAGSSKNVNGIVQSSSSSGNTLYVEPMEVVEINNTISSVNFKIEEERKKILFEIGERIKSKYDMVDKTITSLYNLDFELAKAKLADYIKAEKPDINNSGNIEIYKGRHPLLDEEEVVPIDIWLKDNKKGLIITGPNAGGKTVSLKTVGLFTIMTMYGLLIPAKEWSNISVFKNIFVDIGDTQSIEQNLSTFSGHITNFQAFIHNVTDKSLILMDEVGAGTDPEEGAALAMSLIDYFIDKGADVFATTHFNSLKRHSIEDKRLENASCLFDYDNIEPLYKIKMGTPGSSSGLIVAEKLGIPSDIIKNAKNYMDKEHLKLEETINKLEKQLSETENLKDKLERENKELSEKMEYYEEEIEKISNKRKRKKLESIIDFENEFFNIKDQLNKVLNEIKNKEKNEIKQNEVTEKFDKAIKKAKKERKKVEKKMEKIKNPQEGDKIYLEKYGFEGKIEQIEDQKCILNCNGMKVEVKKSDLIGEKIDSDEKYDDPEQNTNYSVDTSNKFVGNEIVLVGMRRQDALDKLGDFLSHVILEGHKEIKIVHGVGKGILRNAVQDFLRDNSNVKNFYFEDRRKVVTIAEL